MKNWTIKRRIVVGFAAVLLLVICQAAAAFLLNRSIATETRSVATSTLPALTVVARMKALVGEIQITVLRAMLAPTAEERKQHYDKTTAMRGDILKLFDEYEALVTRAEDRALLEKLKTGKNPVR